MKRRKKKLQKPGDSLPKSPKNRTQKPAYGLFPGQPPQKQAYGIAKPDVPRADAEGQIDPAQEGTQHKNQVAQSPWFYKPQKAVEDT